MDSDKSQGKSKLVKKIVFPVITSLIFISTVTYLNNQDYGLALEYNGKEIVTINHEKVYEEAQQMIRNQLPKNEKDKLHKINTQIKLTPASKDTCCEKAEIVKEKIIESSNENLNYAYELFIDNQSIAISSKKEELYEILDKLLEKDKKNYKNIEKAEFQEKIEIKEGIFSKEKVKGYNEIEKLLTEKVEKISSYIVDKDDTVVSIAEKFSMTPNLLLELNNKKESESIFVGEKINVLTSDTLLHTKIITKEIQNNDIPFETILSEDSNLEKGRTILLKEGSNGKENIAYNVTYIDNLETNRKEISRKTIVEPINEEKIIGTKVAEYIWPLEFTRNITSGFGPRWGTFHYGIDIAQNGVKGTNILASKSGVVEKATYGKTGYGNHIIIDHKDGTKTVYGHCESLNVSVGQAISQGDKIATVGSTGDSTGPHLHFEVRINGERKNPLDYLK